MLIRPAANEDSNAIWAIMEPIIQAGETYALPRDMGKDSALAYRLSAEREVFIAEDNGHIVGTYGLQANQKGGGAHVANCGYMTALWSDGARRGASDVRAFAEPCAGARISRHAIQFRDQHQRADHTAVAELWLRDGWAPLRCLPASDPGICRAYIMYRDL